MLLLGIFHSFKNPGIPQIRSPLLLRARVNNSPRQPHCLHHITAGQSDTSHRDIDTDTHSCIRSAARE